MASIKSCVLRDVRFRIDDDRFIACRMTYSLGGPNVWTGKATPRGYRLSVMPIKMVRGFCEYAPVDGVTFVLKEVARASHTAEADASRVMDKVLDDLVRMVCDKNGIDPAALGPRIDM